MICQNQVHKPLLPPSSGQKNAANLGVVVVVEVICLLWDGRFLVRLVLVAVSVSMSVSREAQLIV